MPGWLQDSKVLEKFEPSLGKKEEADAKQFAEASLALISVFDLITGMGMASADMTGNANTLLKAANANPGSTLKSLIDAECAGKDAAALKKIAGDGKTVSCALLWLARALNFIIKMLEELIANPGKKLSDCVLAGYEVSLKPHHGMMIRTTFSVGVKAAPYRDAFVAKLGPSEEEVFGAIKGKQADMSELVKSVQGYLKTKDPTIFAD